MLFRRRFTATLSLGLLVTAGLSACDLGERHSLDGLAACGGTSMQNWIGQPVGTVASRLPGVRILDPGSINTYDFRPERLNVHVDGSGIVRSLSCG
jgi:hypothetical protein